MGRRHRLVRAVRPRVAVEARFPRPLRIAARVAVQRLHPAELRISLRARMVNWRWSRVRRVARRAASGDRSLRLHRCREVAASPSDSSAFPRAPSSPPRVSRGTRRRGASTSAFTERSARTGRSARATSPKLKFKYDNADVQFTQQLTNLVLAAEQSVRCSRRHAARRAPLGGVRARRSRSERGATREHRDRSPRAAPGGHRLHGAHEHDDHRRLRVDRLQIVQTTRTSTSSVPRMTPG